MKVLTNDYGYLSIHFDTYHNFNNILIIKHFSSFVLPETKLNIQSKKRNNHFSNANFHIFCWFKNPLTASMLCSFQIFIFFIKLYHYFTTLNHFPISCFSLSLIFRFSILFQFDWPFRLSLKISRVISSEGACYICGGDCVSSSLRMERSERIGGNLATEQNVKNLMKSKALPHCSYFLI